MFCGGLVSDGYREGYHTARGSTWLRSAFYNARPLYSYGLYSYGLWIVPATSLPAVCIHSFGRA